MALPYSRLATSLHIDVVVVGAGITGALVAEALTRRGNTVLVMDRRPPVHGSTMASTALLQYEIDVPLLHLAANIGHARASRVWQRSFGAVTRLIELAQTLQISCALRPREALYLAGDTLDAEGLREECALRQGAGLPSRYLTHTDLHAQTGMRRAAALRSGGAADVDPAQLATGLLAIAASRGARICSPTELSDIHPASRKVEMITSDGVEISAKSVIFATGYELARGVPLRGHRRSSTWAFATRPQPANIWGAGEVIWEAANPYLYIRSTVDGRVIVGGEDEEFDDEARRDAKIPAKIASLQAKLAQLLPELETDADYQWAGTFGESTSGLPSIGAIPGQDNCYAVLGYGGNGITFGMVAAEILAAALSGTPDRDADLFDFKA